jgi:polyribonucleotide nucleotidyltransferase
MESFKLEIGEKILEIEKGNFAELAPSSAIVKMGETVVLVTLSFAKEQINEISFFPLSVEYEERYYAAGKIRGPKFIKRELKPTEEAICNARLIDRAIRPLFPKDFKKEVQIIATVLSWDGQIDPDILAINGASIVALNSPVPFEGPLAAVRVGKVNGKFLINPTYQQRENSKIDVVFAATKEKDSLRITALEGSFEEVPEEEISKAFVFAKEYLEKILEFQKQISSEIEKIKTQKFFVEKEIEIKKFLKKNLEKIFPIKDKNEFDQKIEKIKEEVKKIYPLENFILNEFLEEKLREILREMVFEKGERFDGRKAEELREIEIEIGILPRTHGSAIFKKGQTKTLSILTLGAPGDVQFLEGMEITGKKRFLHHYNFPPYCTGEVKPLKGPSRREIGHGLLVERGILPLIPDFDQFPYTIRIVSEVLSSNGSTSMASVCSSSLALFDAGVPMKKHVAGIGLGLVTKENGEFEILADIQGLEDAFGEMDFKIVGTRDGITATQLDVKTKNFTEKILEKSLKIGREKLNFILDLMEKKIKRPREKISDFAPKIFRLEIDPEKIRDVIGPGGKRITEIIEECGVSIDIEPTGKVFITGEKEEAVEKAAEWIKNITKKVNVGEVFYGKIKRILSFGMIVEILPGQEGLVHLSTFDRKTKKNFKDLFSIGDIVLVKVVNIDEMGRISLKLIKKKNE